MSYFTGTQTGFEKCLNALVRDAPPNQMAFTVVTPNGEVNEFEQTKTANTTNTDRSSIVWGLLGAVAAIVILFAIGLVALNVSYFVRMRNRLAHNLKSAMVE